MGVLGHPGSSCHRGSCVLIYGFANDWHIPGSTMNAWLAATVVQVIAVGLVITKSLFPSKRAT